MVSFGVLETVDHLQRHCGGMGEASGVVHSQYFALC